MASVREATQQEEAHGRTRERHGPEPDQSQSTPLRTAGHRQPIITFYSCHSDPADIKRVMTKMISAVACGVSLLLLTGCGPEWEREAVSRSPDGRLLAVVEYKGAAACCSDHSRLRLVEQTKGTLAEEPFPCINFF